MVSLLATTLGRLLIVPVALSGVCLTMLLGTPMAHAMSPTDSHGAASIHIMAGDHVSVMVVDADQAQGANCCLSAKQQHEAGVTASHEPTKINFALKVDSATEASRFPVEILRSIGPPPGPLDFSTITLTGTTIKRE